MKIIGGTGTDQATIMVKIVNGDIFVGGYTSSKFYSLLPMRVRGQIGGFQTFFKKFSSAEM